MFGFKLFIETDFGDIFGKMSDDLALWRQFKKEEELPFADPSDPQHQAAFKAWLKAKNTDDYRKQQIAKARIPPNKNSAGHWRRLKVPGFEHAIARGDTVELLRDMPGHANIIVSEETTKPGTLGSWINHTIKSYMSIIVPKGTKAYVLSEPFHVNDDDRFDHDWILQVNNEDLNIPIPDDISSKVKLGPRMEIKWDNVRIMLDEKDVPTSVKVIEPAEVKQSGYVDNWLKRGGNGFMFSV